MPRRADNASQLPYGDPSRRRTPDDDVLWGQATAMLNGFISRLEPFGQGLNSNAGEPDLQTMLDMAAELDDLQKRLVKLDRWLNNKPQKWWLKLQEGLNDARTRYWTKEVRVAFNQYRRACTDNTTRSTTRGKRQSDDDRIVAGDGIIEFMGAIQLAIQEAQKERDSAK